MFSAEYILDYRGIRPDLTVTFPRYLEYMQETSLRHTQSTPYPMEWFQDNLKAFFLTNWQVKILKYPHWNDKITINSWPIYFKGVMAERYFVVKDASGSSIALANSRWCFSDIQKHRPTRPPSGIADGYGEIRPSELEQDYSLKPIEDYTFINEYKILVTRRETDSNYHVNNVKYIEWAMDFVPDDIYDHYQIVGMKAAYKKECSRGRTALVETRLGAKNENGVEICSIIRDGKETETIFAEIHTQWSRYTEARKHCPPLSPIRR